MSGIYFSFSLSLLQNISYDEKETKAMESYPGFGCIFPLNNYSYLENILEENLDEHLKYSLCWFIKICIVNFGSGTMRATWNKRIIHNEHHILNNIIQSWS